MVEACELPRPRPRAATFVATTPPSKSRTSHEVMRSSSVESRSRRRRGTAVSSVRSQAGSQTTPEVSDRVRDFLSRVEESDALKGITFANGAWQKIQALGDKDRPEASEVITSTTKRISATGTPTFDYDVVVCGGVLGIFLATALARRGWHVAVLERGTLQGRDQEWNISRRELQTLLDEGLCTEEELEHALVTEYNPARVGFANTLPNDVLVRDVLNCGVSPRRLIESVRQRFEKAGGTLMERVAFQGAEVAPDGVRLTVQNMSGGSGALGAGGGGTVGSREGVSTQLTVRLMIDVMGNFSPVVQQLRGNVSPDGVCVVVGCCAEAQWPQNDRGDLIYSFTPIENKLQYFWEAFPSQTRLAGGGRDPNAPSLRTTYMFTYMDSDKRRPSLQKVYDAYLRWLPEYQKVRLEDIHPKRALFGAFPTYRDSPLRPTVDRLLLFGDSSGVQSPLSFGGFGAMLRHLPRFVRSTSDALENDQLDRSALTEISPYLPSLSVTWLFQRAMSVRVAQNIGDVQLINRLLGRNFGAMQNLGDSVLLPFLQDVVQFPALSRTMIAMMLTDPPLVARIVSHVGVLPVLDWMRHFIALGAYDVADRLSPALTTILEPVLQSPVRRSAWQRKRDAWAYGSGRDFHAHE